MQYSHFSLLPLLLCRNSPSMRVLGKSSSSSSITETKMEDSGGNWQTGNCFTHLSRKILEKVTVPEQSNAKCPQSYLTQETERLTALCWAEQTDNGLVEYSEWWDGERGRRGGEENKSRVSFPTVILRHPDQTAVNKFSASQHGRLRRLTESLLCESQHTLAHSILSLLLSFLSSKKNSEMFAELNINEFYFRFFLEV